MGIYLSKDGISYLWAKIKNKFYIKPSTGIPKSDLASSVQASLGKADTALQKHQDISGKVDNTAAGANSLLSKITNSWTATPTDDTYFIRQDTSSKNEFGRVKFSTLWSYIKSKVESLGYTKNTGTITGIKMNGASKGTSGVVDLGTVITAHQDISGKQDKSTAVTHSTNTAVGSTTKPVYIAANGAATPISHSINSDVPANAEFTDTTYSDATQSAHGLMTAADKAKLDDMDLSQYLPLHGTADIAKTLSNGSMRYGWCVNSDASANSGYRWFCVGKLPKSQLGFLTEILYLNVCGGYGLFGVLRVFVRTDSTGKNVEQMNVTWLARDATTSRPQFKLVAIESDTGVSFELWCYTTARWQQMFCNVIADLNLTGGLYNRWALETHSAADAKNATTVGTKSVTDIDMSYASRATALTESAWTAVPETGADSTSERDLKYLVMGNTVYVQGYLKFSAGNNNPKCGTLPSGARPSDTLYFTGWDTNGVPAAYPIVVNSVGIIMLLNPTSTAYWFKSGRAYRFNFCYHIG